MSQKINLNSYPYFDDFDESKNYKRVLFKPGTSIQARELTTLQSILQNQVEIFSNTAFSEGDVVDGGNLNFISDLDYVILEDNFNGIPISEYIEQLVGVTLVGSVTGITAEVIHVISASKSDRGKNTLYIKYTGSNSQDFTEQFFRNSENLITLTTINSGTTTFFQNTPLAKCTSNNSTGKASATYVSSGKIYARGFFVNFAEKFLILEQYNTNPSYKVGFEIGERVVTSLEDSSLNDNARGFSNFSSPGADRLEITCTLNKKQLDDLNTDTFVEVIRIENGKIVSKNPDKSYNFIEDELARRTYDESGDYVVDDFNVEIEETLTDLKTNTGIYLDTERTYKNNQPSDDLVSISISPGKAYVRGYEIEKISNTIFEVEKSRSSKNVENATIPINFGKKIKVNNISGEINTGFTTYFAELRDSRKDGSYVTGSGEIIGNCRIYDAKLRSEYENESTEQDLYLYDVQYYTELTVSSDFVSIPVGSKVQGKYSGAVGFVRGSDGLNTNPAGVSTVKLYNISGEFVNNEPFFVDNDLNSRIIKNVTNFGLSNLKSIRMVGSGSTYTSDVVLDEIVEQGPPANIYHLTIGSAGVSTVTCRTNDFSKVKVNDVVQYTLATVPGSIPNYAKVTSINSDKTQIEIGTVTAVPNVNTSILPPSSGPSGDFNVIRTRIEESDDPGFYTTLPEQLISSINTDNSTVRIRKEYVSNVTSGTFTVTEGSPDFAFLPFALDRYILTYSDGTIEPLNSQKVIINPSNPRQITLRSLTKSTDTDTRLVSTLQKNTVTTTNKNIRSSHAIVQFSTELISGTGENTLNDGLTPDTSGKYGTRIQDKEICLLHPDIVRVNGIFESTDVNDPTVPTITLSSTTSPLTETISGEEFYGEKSGALAKVVPTFANQINTSSKVNFVYLNSNRFQYDEKIVFRSSKIEGYVQGLTFGSKDVTSNYTLDNGQRNDYYDYGRIIKTKNDYVPTRRLLVIFERYSIDTSNDLVTFNSYNYIDYSNDVITFNSRRNPDIIDFRPRVPFYNRNTNDYGPFFFLGRKFENNSSSLTVIDDEVITLDYSFYLPRIDKIYLTKEGIFEYKKGIPSEIPNPPLTSGSSLDLFTLYYPSYTFDAKDIYIDSSVYKRYTMKDLRTLETRVENLEKYTTLSLLELEANSLPILDEATGLERFKTGFFVDNFNDEVSQNTSNPYNMVSIDPNLGDLRPKTYTTSLDLIWGSKSLIGIGTEPDPTVDISVSTDLESDNLQKSGNIVTLKYDNTVFLDQPYSNDSIKINDANISNYVGNMNIYPVSDSWFDQNNYKKVSDSVIDPYIVSSSADRQENTNFFGNRYHSWKDFWTGRNKYQEAKVRDGKIDKYFWKSGLNSENNTESPKISFSTLNSPIETQNSKTIEKKIFNKNVIPYLRRRNFAFECNSLKPVTRFYPFFDKISASGLVVPKLLEIEMISGTFEIGEDVVALSLIENAKQSIVSAKFRLAQTNHYTGSYNSATSVYKKNPYTGEVLQSSYSQTSSVINIDLNSLSDISLSQYYGIVSDGMNLVGQTSGAKARVKEIKLISNEQGLVQGSIYIPSYFDSPKSFLSGRKTFKLTSDSFNAEFSDTKVSFGEAIITSFGAIPIYQNDVFSVRPNSYTKFSDKTDTVSGDKVLNTYGTNEFDKNLSLNTGYATPLTQLLYVEESSGIFATSVDIFFKSTDSELPITLELKTVKNGLPTSLTIPLSKKTVYPAGITTSTNSSTETKFEFESPVFLEGNKLYALTLSTDSDQYEVYSANYESNTTDLISNNSIDKVSSIGSLYNSSNTDVTFSSTKSIKFKLNKALFTSKSGTLTLYNPNLDFGNNQKTILSPNPIIAKSNKIIIGLSTHITNVGIATLGLQVTQSANASQTGFIVDTLGAVGLGTTSLLPIAVGTGLSPTSGTQDYDVTFTSLSGRGTGLAATITVVDGVIPVDGVSVTNGGSLFSTNEVLTTTIGNTGIDYEFKVGIRTAITSFVLNDVQGSFNSVDNLLIRNVSTGSTSNFTLQGLIPTTSSNYEDDLDGLHMIVNHNNHGMYSDANKVELSYLSSDQPPTTLGANISASSLTIDIISPVADFGSFEGISVGSTNPGYIQIGEEIISYTDINGNTLSGVTRGVDSTVATSHLLNDFVYKYETNGVSLRRLNRQFNLDDVTTTKENTYDSYYLKIDMTENGTDRTGASFPKLFFKETKDIGGSRVSPTQNILFDEITPNIQTFTPNFCEISGSVRTISGTSEDGSQVSYRNLGFSPISLDETTEFLDPRLIGSRVNELEQLDDLPGNKSLTLRLNLVSNDSNLSPVIDLERTNAILTSNKINNPVSDYTTNAKSKTLSEDPHQCVYVSKPVNLKLSSTGLKVLLDAYKPNGSDVRVFYKTTNTGENSLDSQYIPFPGYSNLDSSGLIINSKNSDGSSDKFINYSNENEFKNHSFTLLELEPFTSFTIKIVMTSESSSVIPKIRNLRVVSLA